MNLKRESASILLLLVFEWLSEIALKVACERRPLFLAANKQQNPSVSCENVSEYKITASKATCHILTEDILS